MLISVALFVVLISIGWFWYKWKFSYWSRQGVKEWPAKSIFGNFDDVISMKAIEAYVADECYKQLGDVKFGGYYFLWKPLLMIKDPELVKNITIKDFEHFSDHSPFLDSTKGTDIVLHSIFFMKSEEWKKRRSVLTHLFTPKRLKTIHTMTGPIMDSFFPKFDQCAKDDLDIDMDPTLTELTMNVITKTFIGIDVKDQSAFLKASHMFSYPDTPSLIKSFLYTLHPLIHKVLGLTTLNKGIYALFSELVERVVRLRKEQNIVSNDLFDFLIKCQNGVIKNYEDISMGEMIGHTFVFFFAGHDTTTLTGAMTVFELSRNPEVQKKLRSEIKRAVEERNEGLSYETLNAIPYLSYVIQETTRMYPVLGVIKRVCTKPYNIGDFSVPVGMDIIFPVRSLHYDPRYFEDPHSFKPERFAEGKTPEVFMPFGKGPRICIGMRFAESELKLLISRLVLDYDILPSRKNQLPFKFDRTLAVTIRPVGGIWVKLKARADNYKSMHA
ncbi:probable cytochrome P450 6d5 [Cimex lectularius]|uniref:Cytochrome P450 CYP397A1V2 n=1 Tax=Cimex lectularius TaxID=79782 RepID=H6U7G9_CIMLE|nr:probable cytochrome P450 6d5 [Cimex lectularius]AFA35117.1 cytochrome P450 CYP397A1V2 [Cimex lectularius]